MRAGAGAASEQSFWGSLIAGALKIVAGILLWGHPAWFMPLVGIVAIVEGVRLAWQGLFAKRGDNADLLRILLGLLTIVLGVAVWLYPDQTAQYLLYTVAGWAVVFGLFIALLALTEVGTEPGAWWEVIFGLLMAVFGVATLVNPRQGGMTLERIASVLIAGAGIAQIVGAFQRRTAP